jgi:hypothetical protein
MGDFKIASDGLVREAEYLRGVGEAQASISQAIMGFPRSISNWGAWEALSGPIVAAFRNLDEVNFTAAEGLDSVADLIESICLAYQEVESANSVKNAQVVRRVP